MGNQCCNINEKRIKDLEISNNLEILKNLESSNTKNTLTNSVENKNQEIKKDILNEIFFKNPSNSLEDILISKKFDTEGSNIF